MNIQTILSTEIDAYIVKNIYPLYIHDLSPFSGDEPNEHGVVEPEPVRTIGDQAEVQDIWWRKADTLFPFIIQVGAKPAGFALVTRPPHAPQTADYMLFTFFLLHAVRGRGVGREAACSIFSRFRGQWQLDMLIKNLPAQAFWRKVIREYTANRFEERTVTNVNGLWQIYRFDNTGSRP